DQLRQMQDRNIKFRAQVVRNLALKTVEYRVAKRARRHHRLRPPGLVRRDLLAGQLNRDFFVVRGGMEAAAFRPAAVVDGAATQYFSEPLKRDVVRRVDDTVTPPRS